MGALAMVTIDVNANDSDRRRIGIPKALKLAYVIAMFGIGNLVTLVVVIRIIKAAMGLD
jgi:hypothetical protein